MRTAEHQHHIASRIAHNDCQECRADCERQFLRPQWPEYRYVADYLAWAKPRLLAIKNGETSANAYWWRRDFRLALQRRITLKTAGEQGRKRCDSYLQRLGQFSRNPQDNHFADSAYLKHYAQRGASTLY